MELLLAAVVLVLGLFMAIAPKLAIKKDKRDDAAAVKKMRICGIFLSIFSIVCGVGIYMLM